MKKIGMVGVVNKPVKNLDFHNGGWTYVCKSIAKSYFKTSIDILTEKDNWDDYDVLVINEGVSWTPKHYGMFGGIQEKQKTKIRKMACYKGEIYSIDFPVDYNFIMWRRKDCIEFSNIKFRTPKVIKLNEVFDKLVLGDSHSLSVYKKGYSISKNDGTTLYKFLREGIRSYVKDNIKELIFYAGNIDVRFHMCRLDVNVKSMCLELAHQLKNLNLEKVSVVALLPIENEERKMPGTGKYKDQNFFGTREERLDYVIEFNNEMKKLCQKNGFEFLEWDFDYDQELSYNYMERRQSVHLRPKSYMFKNFIENELEHNLFSKTT